MQTLSVQIEDHYIQQFMTFVKNSHSNVTLTQDNDLDPYFNERQKELQQIRADIKSGKTKMLSHDNIWKNINEHIDKH